MPKYEIEIDLPADVLAKWKPVAVRKGNVGDFVDWCGNIEELSRKHGDWDFLILEPVKQYRTPSLPEDEGKLSEFSNDGFTTSHFGRLFAYTGKDNEFGPWISLDQLDINFTQCRIEVTE